MRDEYQERFSEPGRENGSRYPRDPYVQDSRDEHEHYTPRQDYSRSPSHRQDDHGRPSGTHRHPMDSRGRSQDSYPHDRPDGRSRGRDSGPPRGPRHGGRQYDDYESMYDEPRRENESRDRYRDERRSPRGRSYRDRDGPRRRSRSPGRYPRSRSMSPTKDAGKPTDTVILEGLPFCISSTELHDSLLGNSIASEFPSIDVRISSAKGIRRAFVQFEHVDQAIAFIKAHYPKILVPLQQSTDEVPEGQFDAYVHYARNRDDDTRSNQPGDWNCPQCDFSNFATRSKCRSCGSYPSGTHWQQSLTGAADAADVPSQILVVYPLPAFADEDMLAREMKRLEVEKPDPAKDTSAAAPKLKSTAPTSSGAGYGAKQGSLHRVFLMRDSQSDESFKYGFAEFWTLEDAAAAVKKVQMARAFNIAGSPVTISTIHMGVFLPEERELTPLIERRSFNPLFNPELRVRYRDHHVYPSQQIVTAEPPGGFAAFEAAMAASEDTEDKKSKKRKADGNLPSSSTAKKPLAMAGKMAMWQRKHDELRGEAGADPNANPDPDAPPKLSSANAAIKINLSSSNKFSNPNLAEEATSSAAAAPASASLPEGSPPASASTPVSYVDRDRLMCLICMRKYKSTEEVDIHEKSRNHKTAMEDEALVKAALPRIAARDKRIAASASASTSSAPQYRDRAKERRQVYSQPKKPSGAPAGGAGSVSQAPPPQEEAKADVKAGKGAGMLAKMGWTAGQGLGADGSGRTQTIETHAYQQGVGLGAEGGNLGDATEVAERQTKGGYKGYVDSVQDKARERYNKMG